MLKYADFDWQSNANRVGFCKFGLYELELLEFYFYEHDIFPLYAIFDIKLKL